MQINILATSENQSTFFFSNRVDRLFDLLKENLFPPGSSPFSKRLIVIPSQAMENWIRLRLASDPEIQIACGFEVLFLRQAVESLSTPSFSLDPLQLTLKIEQKIYEKIESRLPLWEPLSRYLRGKKGRHISLSNHLATLFTRYGVYGGRACSKWEKNPENWQQALWQEIAKEWKYPLKTYQETLEIKSDLQVHLFCFSHIAAIDLSFFQKISNQVPVFFYQLSPCQEFWSDLPSERGAFAINELYLEERHPLLANLGKVGKQMARLIEESEVMTVEEYEEPEGKTQLERLQGDLLYLSPSDEVLEDDSIQVHNATTPLREIEILHNLLLAALQQEDMEPKDIIVMAPDITLYAPFIRAIFNGVIDYQIMDMPLQANNAQLEGLFLILNLEKERWSAPSVFRVLKHPLFKSRRLWSEEDLLNIHTWIRQSGIRWGFNAQHKGHLLNLRHCEKGAEEEGSTWEEGFGRLLEGLALTDGMNLTEAELLGDVAASLYGLRADLKELYLATCSPLLDWTCWLKKLMEEHFAFSDEREALFLKLDKFANAGTVERTYCFETVELLLRQWLSQESATIRSHSLQTVRFCSLLPMRAIPAKIICLIGMNHETFPRKDKLQSLDLLKNCEEGDYYPTRTDFDRYLFLEALLSARQKLILIYQGRNALDHAIQPPSILISEILPYVHKTQQIIHPARSYDPSYFDGTKASLFNFSRRDAAMAKSLSTTKGKLPSLFTITPSPPPLPEGTITIDLVDLIRCLRDPLKHYLKMSCGVVFREEKEMLAEENFTLSPLQLAKSRKILLTQPLTETIRQEENFPLGPFGKLAARQLEKESASLEGMFGATFAFIAHQKTAQLDEKGVWRLPAPIIELSSKLTVYLTGRLEGILPNVLCALEKKNWRGALKIWPQFLLLSASKLPNDFTAMSVLFVRTGEKKNRFFENPEPFLHTLIEYYFWSMHTPSPLYPDWILPFLKNDPIALEKALESKLYDPVLKWALREREPFHSGEMIDRWHMWAKRLYQELNDAWL